MKKKFTINLTKGYILSIILFFMGMGTLLFGLYSLVKVWFAIPIGELKESQLKEGWYVEGMIQEYLGFVDPEDQDNFRTVSESYLNIEKGLEYDFYTVKIAEGKYINVLVDDEEKKETLENYVEGKGNSAYFEGMVIKNDGELNYIWYQQAFGVESEEEVDEFVISRYAIIENPFEVDTMKICTGAMIVILSVMIFFISGGVKGLIIYWNAEEENE